MGGGAVLEAMAELCHHSEEVHVELFGVKLMPNGELEKCSFAYTSKILLTISLYPPKVNYVQGDRNTFASLLQVYMKLLKVDMRNT